MPFSINQCTYRESKLYWGTKDLIPLFLHAYTARPSSLSTWQYPSFWLNYYSVFILFWPYNCSQMTHVVVYIFFLYNFYFSYFFQLFNFLVLITNSNSPPSKKKKQPSLKYLHIFSQCSQTYINSKLPYFVRNILLVAQ